MLLLLHYQVFRNFVIVSSKVDKVLRKVDTLHMRA